MKTAVLILSIFLLTSAFASDLANSETNQLQDSSKIQTKSWLTNIIEKLIKNIFPSLENLYIQKLNLGEKIGSFSDVTILHAEEAQLLPITGTGLNIKNFTLVLDRLNVTGYYDLVSLKLPGPIFLNGHGKFSIGLENFTLSTGINIRAPGSELVVNGFPNFYLFLNHSYLNFEHLMGNDPVGDLLNSIISDALPKLVEAAYGTLIEALTPLLNIVFSNIFTCFKNHIIDQNFQICFSINKELDVTYSEIISLLEKIQ